MIQCDTCSLQVLPHWKFCPVCGTPRDVIKQKDVLSAIATLLDSPANRFGKLEFYSVEAMAAREQIRKWAVELKLPLSQSVLEQAAKVARAALKG